MVRIARQKGSKMDSPFQNIEILFSFERERHERER